MGDARDGARSPIDIVQAYLPTRDAAEAAMWLCERLGARPDDLGWRGGQRAEAPGSTGTSAGGDTGTTSTGGKETPPPPFEARPFAWIDPSQIPVRRWVLGRHLIRK